METCFPSEATFGCGRCQVKEGRRRKKRKRRRRLLPSLLHSLSLSLFDLTRAAAACTDHQLRRSLTPGGRTINGCGRCFLSCERERSTAPGRLAGRCPFHLSLSERWSDATKISCQIKRRPIRQTTRVKSPKADGPPCAPRHESLLFRSFPTSCPQSQSEHGFLPSLSFSRFLAPLPIRSLACCPP